MPRDSATSNPARIGTAAEDSRAETRLASSISSRCPARPKPVMSVQARTPNFAKTSAAELFAISICSIASSKCAAEHSPRIHAAMMAPVPSGFVRIKASPGTRFPLRKR